MEGYWLIFSSPFGAIKLNENIESDRHSLETSSDILNSDTCEMIVTRLKGQILRGYVRVMTTGKWSLESLGYQNTSDLDDTSCCTPASVQSATTGIDKLLTSSLAVHPNEHFKQDDGELPTFCLGDTRHLKGIRRERRSR